MMTMAEDVATLSGDVPTAVKAMTEALRPPKQAEAIHAVCVRGHTVALECPHCADEDRRAIAWANASTAVWLLSVRLGDLPGRYVYAVPTGRWSGSLVHERGCHHLEAMMRYPLDVQIEPWHIPRFFDEWAGRFMATDTVPEGTRRCGVC